MSDNEKDISALVPTVVEQEADFTVVANSPKGMEAAQRSLILWAARKIQAEKELLHDAQEQFDIAKAHKWGTGGWPRRIQLSQDKIEYYRKIKMALEAGYYIVPPFPISIFAVRTDQKAPTTKVGWVDATFAATQGIPSKALTAEQGDYVANRTRTRTWSSTDWTKKDPITDKHPVTHYHTPSAFLPVEFPFKLAKSAVMSETAHAMALKVFDQIGIMGVTPAQTAAKTAVPDPIVCGQILSWFHKKQPVTFFIAWWLDTKIL